MSETSESQAPGRSAKGCATKKNNKLRRAYPLFEWAGLLDEWYTTPEAEQTRINYHHARAIVYFERLDAFNAQQDAEAQELRAQVAALVEPEALAALDKKRTIYPPSAVYGLTHWRRTLATLTTQGA